MRAVGKTRFSVKYLSGGQNKLWVSKAGQNEAGIRKENGMMTGDYRPSFQVMSWFELSMATLVLKYQVNCCSCFPEGMVRAEITQQPSAGGFVFISKHNDVISLLLLPLFPKCLELVFVL